MCEELLNTDKIGMVICTGNVGSKSVADMFGAPPGASLSLAQLLRRGSTGSPARSARLLGETLIKAFNLSRLLLAYGAWLHFPLELGYPRDAPGFDFPETSVTTVGEFKAPTGCSL